MQKYCSMDAIISKLYYITLIRSLFTMLHLTSKNFYNSLKFRSDCNLLPFLYANAYLFACASGVKKAQALRNFVVKESYHTAMLIFGQVFVFVFVFNIKNFYNSLKFHRDSNLLPFLYANGIFFCLRVRG